MSDKFFTFLLDFEGGTYISQFHSESLRKACEKWALGLNTSTIALIDESAKSEIRSNLDTEEAIGIEGLTNVWCLTFLIKKELALLHVVLTG